ncbi:hypothetical protein KFK09_005688 [Dendrobium nobile]|uniref:Protein kinase domain-containing protein n=1 Tax=Dendrobium nobile TaxID=94219 RepID=A0A8T3C189_DENNO|nr:hypothetical protein KFK09_005688 [Dendrobium nobile]
MFSTLLLLFHTYLSPTAADIVADAAALMAFRTAVGRLALPWNTSVSFCKWPGVICTGDRVTSLHLPASGLIGQIPAGTLGNLSDLQTLSLRFNALSSPLPSDLSRCTQLRNLYLHGNRFSGDIPEFLPSLTALVHLNLADNSFSGEIPLALNNLTRLGTLYLERNQLIGRIPELDLPNLIQFNVSFNRLNGSVPSKLRGMPADAFLDMPLCGEPLSACPGGDSSGRSKLSGGAIAGIAIGSLAVFLIVFGVLFLLCRRKGKTGDAKPFEVEVALGDKKMKNGFRADGKPAKAAAAVAPAALESQKQLVFFGDGHRVFDLGDLLRASAEVLGKGTFGTAYKVMLEMGIVVAVKRLQDVNMSPEEFSKKIEAIGAMDHPNLVPLLAYYFSKNEKLLVYAYMPMGSLSSILHGNRGSGRSPLNWEIRTSIALAAARGIEHIHSTSLTASHGNIKSSNVLLASSSEVRVADHCLAHLAGNSIVSDRFAGYRAPEVTDTQKVSQKADVYSFGVLLLELITGKAPAQAILNEGGVDLPRWVQSVIHEEWMTEVFDMELLRYQNGEEEMVQMLQLGVDCTAQIPDQRPTMSAVVVRIDEIRQASLLANKEQHQQQALAFDVDD